MLKGLNGKSVNDGLATFEVSKGSSLRRTDIVELCTQASVFVVSIERQGARLLERLQDLESELRQAKAEVPEVAVPRVLQHQHTVASLQLFARLHEAITKARRAANESDAQPTTNAAGDARMFDLMRLVDRHAALLQAHEVQLPAVTTAKIVERFDWHGDIYALGARLVHSELIGFYRKSLHEIARDARTAAQRTDDEHARTQYQALCQRSESLEKVLDATVLKRQ